MSIDNRHSGDMRTDAAGAMHSLWMRLPRILFVTAIAIIVALVVPGSAETAMILGVVAVMVLVLQVVAVLVGAPRLGRAQVERQVYAAVEQAVLGADAEAEKDAEFDVADLPRPVGVPRDDLGRLVEAVRLRQLRTVLLANVGERAEMVAVVERLIAAARSAGLSVVAVDAGSGEMSSGAGISDLAAERSEYGDVMQRAPGGLAKIAWGRLPTIDRRSSRVATLVEALADVYQVVIVDTGRVGMRSSLPLLADARAGVVLVASDTSSVQVVVEARADIKALGLEVGRVVTLPTARAAVA